MRNFFTIFTCDLLMIYQVKFFVSFYNCNSNTGILNYTNITGICEKFEILICDSSTESQSIYIGKCTGGIYVNFETSV